MLTVEGLIKELQAKDPSVQIRRATILFGDHDMLVATLGRGEMRLMSKERKEKSIPGAKKP